MTPGPHISRATSFSGELIRLALVTLVVFLSVPAFSAELSEADDDSSKYKKFTRARKNKKPARALEISTRGDSLLLTRYDLTTGEIDSRVSILADEFGKENSEVSVSSMGIVISGDTLKIADILDITDSVYWAHENGRVTAVTVTLWSSPEGSRSGYYSRGNRIVVNKNFEIPRDSFINGSALGLNANLRINGEVNHSVIALGGEITIGSEGVIRDHALALGGKVIWEEGGTVYGAVVPALEGRNLHSHWRPWKAERQSLSFTPSFSYDRVDGFTPRVGWKFIDADSTLPDFHLQFGLSASSNRQRGSFSMRQPIAERAKLSLTGRFYKELKTDNERLIPHWQNTLFALLSTTDYRNYYEAEGAEIGILYAPRQTVRISLKAFSDETLALPAHPDLWSLFGGAKQFHPNYRGVPGFLADSINREIDDKRVSGITLRASMENRPSFQGRETEWSLDLEIEKALVDFNSDFEFVRYELHGALSHELTRASVISARARAGGSGGDIPIYRRFYIGGYKWLRGYEHFEFHGTDFWAMSFDYEVSLKPVHLKSLRLFMLYDLAQIYDNVSFGTDRPVFHSLGLGLGLEGLLRVNFARRLDTSDPDIRVTVEF